MNKFKRSGEFVTKATRYLVDHAGHMEGCKEPEFSAHLLLCDVGTRHLDYGLPGALDKAVRGLSARWSKYYRSHWP